MMTDEDTDEQDELEAQFRTATGELQKTVMRLFQDSDIEPYLVVLALARVTGEVGAGAAPGGGQNPGERLGGLGGGRGAGRGGGSGEGGGRGGGRPGGSPRPAPP